MNELFSVQLMDGLIYKTLNVKCPILTVEKCIYSEDKRMNKLKVLSFYDRVMVATH